MLIATKNPAFDETAVRLDNPAYSFGEGNAGRNAVSCTFSLVPAIRNNDHLEKLQQMSHADVQKTIESRLFISNKDRQMEVWCKMERQVGGDSKIDRGIHHNNLE